MWKALILAAGYGTRLSPYTDQTPKPMFTIMGKPVLEYWIKRIIAAGCDEIFINTHHLHEQIEDFVQNRSWPVPVTAIYEPEIMGTGGAVKNIASRWQNGNLLIVNSDIVCDNNLTEMLDWHAKTKPAATLALAMDTPFDCVEVDNIGNVLSFDAKGEPGAMTFTGIQVISPKVLDFIPEGTFYNSIDAYRAMLTRGLTINTRLTHNWHDLGTPEAYREANLQLSARKTFGKIFDDNAEHIEVTTLAGDGSDRIWRRLTSLSGNTMIVADHGLAPPEDAGKTTEVEAFVKIGRHMNALGMAIPRLYFYDCFAGLVFEEDLGDTNLQEFVLAKNDHKDVIAAYMRLIDKLTRCWLEGIKGFELGWTWQTKSYDQNVIINQECGYFRQRLAESFLGIDTRNMDLMPEFEHLAGQINQNAACGLIHRDCQSRNIMVKNDRFYFIDYQGARLGPVQYDLASLLYDPYVMLDENTRELLLGYCLQSELLRTSPDKFENGFYYCAVSRCLQMLGAFAFLSMVKGKTRFKQYIAPALNNLDALVNGRFKNEFPVLGRLVTMCRNKTETISLKD